MFALYLAFPVLSYLADGKHDRILWYGVGVVVVLQVALPGIAPLVGIRWNDSLSMPVLADYLIYPVLGYLLSRTDLKRWQRAVIYGGGIAGFALRFCTIIVNSQAAEAMTDTFGGYLNFPCFMQAIAVFVFAKNINWGKLFKTPQAQRRLSTVSGGSFGIYLIHMILFYYLLLYCGFTGDDLFWRLVMPFVCYACCLAIVLLLKRVPFIRAIVP